jgi:hypothetical protein
MASWLTLYAIRPMDGLSAAALEQQLRQSDWLTLAEGAGLDEQAASALDPRFTRPGPDGAFDGELRYAPDRRPIVLHRWTSAERVAEERDEALEVEPPGGARRFVAGAVEVVGLEMGWSAHENGGAIVAWEVARLLAGHQPGAMAVRDDDDRWYVLDGWAWHRL